MIGTITEHVTATVDDRGRITLPEHVRDRLRLGEYDDLDRSLEGDEIHLRSRRPQSKPISTNCVWTRRFSIATLFPTASSNNSDCRVD
ncbi:AbrB/MazE/SpoVT family DNA-binding domain-containing protein [Halegenticoccus tardaugens]|uniref:AbrB/MazE/SpoVT family DNA-binding domain-containing protein n=1 Tax=Halegenticoccus tardaugens TaxID=2071624 RepID=UPI00100B0FD4